MSTITTINSSDLITNSRATINTNFSNLNTDKIETSVLDTDTALTANSDAKIATQKAVKAYADSVITASTSETTKGTVEEATDAEITASTATGGTGAKLTITPAKLNTFLNRQINAKTIFETAGRFTAILDGAGTNTFNTTGLLMNVTGAQGSGVTMDIGSTSNDLFLNSPLFACTLIQTAGGSLGSAYVGIGIVTKTGAGHTYTTDHAGFKVLISANVGTVYGTQGDGTTETATSALTTLANGDTIDLVCKKNGSSSIDYYWRKNNGSWSSATNLTANIPNTASNKLQFSLSGNTTGTNSQYTLAQATYSV